MHPQEIEAVAQQILASAAMAESDDESGAIHVRPWLASDGPAPGPGVALLSQDGPPRWAPLAPGEGVEDSEQGAAAYSVALALYEARGGAPVVTVSPGAIHRSAEGQPAAEAPVSDRQWFAANPGRMFRIRPHAETDRVPYWADNGASLLTVVQVMPKDPRPSASSIALEAVGGQMPADNDEAVFAAMRAHRKWFVGTPA